MPSLPHSPLLLLILFFVLVSNEGAGQYIGGEKNETANSFCHFEDSFYLIGSTRSYGEGSDDIYTVKVNPALNTEWERTLGYPSHDGGTKIITTKDKKLVFTAYSWASPGPGFREDLFISKTELDGEAIWTTHFGGADTDRPLDIIQTQDSGFVITGLSKGFGSPGAAFVLKLDKDGNIVFQNNFVLSYRAIGKSVVESSSSNLYVLVENNGFLDNNLRSSEYKGATPTEVWLFRLGANGNEIWRKKLSTTGFNFGSEIRIHNGIIHIVGSSEDNSKGSFDMVVTRLTEDGEIMDRHLYGSANFDYGKTLDFDDQDNWYITGTTGGATNNLFPKVIVLKTNPDGVKIWEREYGSEFSNEGVRGLVVNTDKIAVLGTSSRQDGNTFHRDFYFVIINSNGDVIREVNGIGSAYTSEVGPRVNVFPNPSKGVINFTWNLQQERTPTLVVYDIRGKIILSEKLNSEKAQIKIKNAGIYTYRLVFDTHLFFGKIQIN